tara:strand:- start:547 stop:1731 length:1185 start_codon:yes stop_codon:yes gene_type:complete
VIYKLTENLKIKDMAEFTKKVEILRALVRTKDQFKKEFPDAGDAVGFKNISYIPFTEWRKWNRTTPATYIRDIDLEIIEEFKKIFSLGFDQLFKFIDELDKASPTGDERGKEEENVLDVYSVLYYVDCLLRGPYAGVINAQAEEGGLPDVFNAAPDIMGVNAAGADEANSSIPVWGGITADTPEITLGKSPSFLIQLLAGGIVNGQGMFNSNVNSAVRTENTLPFIDKENQLRIDSEEAGGRSKVNPAHGNHMVRDIEKIDLIKQAVEGINKSVEEFLGKKAYQIYLFQKGVNYFLKAVNKAQSLNDSEDRVFDYMLQKFEDKEECDADGVGVEILQLQETKVAADMFGQPFDSVRRREFELKTKNNDGENAFKLYTVEGQLGSGDEPESDPMS